MNWSCATGANLFHIFWDLYIGIVKGFMMTLLVCHVILEQRQRDWNHID